MKTVEQLESDYNRVLSTTIDTHFDSRKNGLLEVIGETLIEILREMKNERERERDRKVDRDQGHSRSRKGM